MMLYEKFKNMDIDFSQLSLEQGDTHSDYFCTPKGARVIGWAGIDGIHCCFVKGFGEMVFAVNPSNLPEDYVHPLARSFEDFLRLILACGLDAAEQAWMWNQGEFDGFLETYPPTPEQRAALDALRDGLELAPIESPYGYIKEVQSSFDYGKIPYSKEYYDLLPDEPEAEDPPERPEWKVYFENGFSSRHYGHDKPGKEITVNRIFTWDGRTWHIPAVYSYGKGIVVDLCVEIEPDNLRAFFNKWCLNGQEEGREFTPEEQEQQMAENPMTLDFQPTLTVNGKPLRRTSGNGFAWVPGSCRPIEEQGQRNQQDWEAVWLMEHYGLDPELGWMFWRYSFPWATKTKPTLKALSLLLEHDRQTIPGPRFTVSGVGDAVKFTYPVTGGVHTLMVAEYEAGEMNPGHLPEKWDYPTHYTSMSYTVEPELPQEVLTVRDCEQGDNPRLNIQRQKALAAIGGADGPTAACSVGIIGGADGPTAIILANGKTGHLHSACSALRFEASEHIEWRMVFYQKAVEGIEIDLLLS